MTAEDTAVEGSLVHEFKIWEFHIAEISDSGVLPQETHKADGV